MRNAEKEAAWARRHQRAGEYLESLEEGQGPRGLGDGVVVEVRILTNAREQGDTLIVVKAREGERRFVAFVGARNIVEAVLAWRQKEAGSGLKWREDVPWGDQRRRE